MATDRLKLYNGALMICKARSIASLTVNEEARRLLDEVWNDSGVRYCLEQGQWQFAMTAAKLEYDTAIEPSFGYRRGFAKPTDWVNTAAVCTDEYFNNPLTQYTDEVAYLFSDLDIIYVKYVSDGPTYGGDFSKWPSSFTEYVKAYFASRICGKIGCSDATIAAIINPRSGILAQAEITAKNRDAQKEPTKFVSPGMWSKSRISRNTGDWRDGGSRNRLIG